MEILKLEQPPLSTKVQVYSTPQKRHHGYKMDCERYSTKYKHIQLQCTQFYAVSFSH